MLDYFLFLIQLMLYHFTIIICIISDRKVLIVLLLAGIIGKYTEFF